MPIPKVVLYLMSQQQLPFYFYVYFEGSPPKQKNPKVLCRRSSPILYVPTFPLEICLNPVPNAQMCVYLTVHITKLQLQTTFPRERLISKESCLHKGRLMYLCAFSSCSGTPSSSHLWVPLPQKNALIWNLPYNKNI